LNKRHKNKHKEGKVKHDCNTCLRTKECCCKKCFQTDDFSIFDSLTPEELDYLVGDKKQIEYKPGEIILKQNTTSTYAI